MCSDSDCSTCNNIGVIGATGLVGKCLLTMLAQSDRKVFAYSRRKIDSVDDGVEWRHLPSAESILEPPIHSLISLAPIWTLPKHFALLEAQRVKRVVALSSTSRFTKDDSSDPAERDIAARLADGENRFRAWAESRDIEWVIIRPTLIYGSGRDKNISEIARFICRWGFFPLLGEARGLRQPVHAEDVALACHAATLSQSAINQAYNLSGGEILPYNDMICRVFTALGKNPRIGRLPRWLFVTAIGALRLLPRYRHLSVNMVDRMNRDMVFAHNDAEVDLGFSPRPFNLEAKDLPECHQ